MDTHCKVKRQKLYQHPTGVEMKEKPILLRMQVLSAGSTEDRLAHQVK